MKFTFKPLVVLSALAIAATVSCKTRNFGDDSKVEAYKPSYKWPTGHILTSGPKKTYVFHWTKPENGGNAVKNSLSIVKFLIGTYAKGEPTEDMEGNGIYGAADPFSTYEDYGYVGYILPVQPKSESMVDNRDQEDGLPFSTAKIIKNKGNKMITYEYHSLATRKKGKFGVGYAVVIRDESIVDLAEFQKPGYVIDATNGARAFNDLKPVFWDSSKGWMELLKKNEKNMSPMKMLTSAGFFESDKTLNPEQLGSYAIIRSLTDAEEGANYFAKDFKTPEGPICDQSCVSSFLWNVMNSSSDLSYEVDTQHANSIEALDVYARGLGAVPATSHKYTSRIALMNTIAKYIAAKDSTKFAKYYDLGKAVAKINKGFNAEGMATWNIK